MLYDFDNLNIGVLGWSVPQIIPIATGSVLKASTQTVSPFHYHQGASKERRVFVLTEVEDELVLTLSHLIDVLAPVKLLNINSSHTDITYAHSARRHTASRSSTFYKEMQRREQTLISGLLSF